MAVEDIDKLQGDRKMSTKEMLPRIFKYLKPQLWRVLIALLFSFINVALDIVTPKFMQGVMDELEGKARILDVLSSVSAPRYVIILAISNGDIIFCDEIENGIHPFIIEKLISLFADKTINKNNAQIIFSTHQPYLLSELTKTQIFFTEKEDLQTEIYRLDDVEGVRNDDNFYTKYLNGVYGGVPEVR